MPNDSRSIRVLLHRHSSPAPQAVQAPASTTILQLKERWYGGGAPCGAAGVVLRLGSPDGRRAYNSMSLAEVSAGSDAVVLWWEDASSAAAPAASPASSSASTATAALIVGLDSLADFGAYDAQTSLWCRLWQLDAPPVSPGAVEAEDGGRARPLLRLYEGGAAAAAVGAAAAAGAAGAEGEERALSGECVLWPSGVLMARFLERRAEALQLCGSRLVELGAGSALPSVVAACCGSRVVATDRAAGAPYLRMHLEANAAAVRERGGPAVQQAALSFGSEEDAARLRGAALFGEQGSL